MFLYVILFISQAKDLKWFYQMITEQQYEFETDLQNASLNHFCIYCKKLLKHTLRILVRLQKQTSNYINICTGCLATHCNDMKIRQYKVCNKMGQIVEQLNHKSVETLISCISLVQNKGIEQIEVIRQGQDEENAIKQSYLELNDKIFGQRQLGFKEKQPKYALPQFQPIVKENNPPNRKHLKALGYNWERRQFEYSPQSVFGLLLGALQKDQDQNEEEYNTLSNILFRQYAKQQEKINQTKDYLVNTMFLLGKKGFNKLQGMPQPLLQLRKKEEEIKQIIPKIYNLINEFERQEKSESPKKEKKHRKDKKQKKQKKKRKREQSQSKEKEEQQYQRSRQAKKKKKREQKQQIQQTIKTNKQEVKQAEKNQKLQQPQLKSQQNQGQDSKRQKAKPQLIKGLNISQNKVENNESGARRGRGRPRGSIRKAKILVGKFVGVSPQIEKQKTQQQIPQISKYKASVENQHVSPQKKVLKKKKKKAAQQKNENQGFQVQFDSD